MTHEERKLNLKRRKKDNSNKSIFSLVDNVILRLFACFTTSQLGFVKSQMHFTLRARVRNVLHGINAARNQATRPHSESVKSSL